MRTLLFADANDIASIIVSTIVNVMALMVACRFCFEQV